MESLRETFFERPFYVYLALGVAELALLALWYERRSRRWALLLLVPVALGGLVYAVERLVVTDREQILAVAQDIARAVERGDADAAAAHLDDRFGGHWATKILAVEAGRAAMRQYEFRRVAITKHTVEVTGRQAHSKAVTILQFGAGDAAGQQTSLIWDVHWIKTDGVWRIDLVEVRHGLEF